jgi:hypothetical protein
MPLALIISPQPWHGFQVSKHHYAMALASRGWKVVFIDPPTDLGKVGRVELEETDFPGVSVLRYQTFFPYILKFRSRTIFNYLMRRQAQRITARTGRPDLVWDFDNAYQFADLTPFGAKRSLFHLVDDAAKNDLGTKNADHTFYLHESFCRHTGGKPKPECLVGHGLGKAHELAALNLRLKQNDVDQRASPHIGFVGNLAANWVDWAAVSEMLHRHPEALFTFWGPLPDMGNADVGLQEIISNTHARFPGLTPPDRIIEDSKSVDAWLIPFCSDKLLGGAIDSHKILEYLSTGKAIVMSWLEAYKDNQLVYMLPSSDSVGLADLLDNVLRDLPNVNSIENMKRRSAYALERTYDRHLEQIFTVAGVDSPAL